MHVSSATFCENEYYKQAMLLVSHLMKFNTFIRAKKDSSSSYQLTQRDLPLPVYLGLMIHNKIRDLSLIEKLLRLGLCISKHRLSQLSISMGNTVIETTERDDMVLPMNLKLGVFSTASVDNIDVGMKSSLSTTSLRGIAASISQHRRRNNEGQSRERVSLNQSVSKLKQLYDWHIEVPPYHLPNDTPVPVCSKPSTADLLESFVLLENETWLQDASSTSWAVFHARSQSGLLHQDTSVMLPIFRDDSRSASTIKHLLGALIKSIRYLNPNQTAVIGFDLLLYSLAKKIQWFQPTAYGH